MTLENQHIIQMSINQIDDIFNISRPSYCSWQLVQPNVNFAGSIPALGTFFHYSCQLLVKDKQRVHVLVKRFFFIAALSESSEKLTLRPL